MLRQPLRGWSGAGRGIGALACLMLLAARMLAAGPPQAELDNGVLHVMLNLPDAVHGYYRGTRFDWSGVIAQLTFAGHSYYGPWFTKMDPSVNDYVFTDSGISASAATADTGPVEEFLQKGDGSGLGFDTAKPGQTFVKLGVGALRKPDERKYSPFRPYELVNGGKWNTKVTRTSVEFQQRLDDPGSGYSYLYVKVIRLIPHEPRMVIEHTLKNLGRQPIETEVFDHNFLVLDHQETGPDFTIKFPFPIRAERPIKTELGGIENDRIFYRRKLRDRESFALRILGHGKTAKDNDFRIENTHVGAGVRITGDQPLVNEELWSIRTVLAMEPFVQISVAPGKTMRWSYNYLYYTFPPKS